MIANKQEIKNLVFSRNFDINNVKDNVINLVELERVKPLLGSELFLKVKTDPSSYADLLELVKPFIAYMLKYYIQTSNHIRTSNKGAQTAQGSNEQIADVELAKREALTFANKYKEQINIFLKKDCNSNAINGIIIM